MLPSCGYRHTNRIEYAESYPTCITVRLQRQIVSSSILDLVQTLGQEYSKSYNIWHWMMQQAVLTGYWLQGQLWITIPSTGRSVVNMMIHRVKYCLSCRCFLRLYTPCYVNSNKKQWRTKGGSKPLPRNSKGPPKLCQTQPDCENCQKLLNLGRQHPKMSRKKAVKF